MNLGIIVEVMGIILSIIGNFFEHYIAQKHIGHILSIIGQGLIATAGEQIMIYNYT